MPMDGPAKAAADLDLFALAIHRRIDNWVNQWSEFGVEGDTGHLARTLAVEVGQDDDRKFEPLRLVNRHEPNNFAFLVGRGCLCLPRGRLEIRAEPDDEVGQGEPALG